MMALNKFFGDCPFPYSRCSKCSSNCELFCEFAITCEKTLEGLREFIREYNRSRKRIRIKKQLRKFGKKRERIILKGGMTLCPICGRPWKWNEKFFHEAQKIFKMEWKELPKEWKKIVRQRLREKGILSERLNPDGSQHLHPDQLREIEKSKPREGRFRFTWIDLE